MKVQDGGICCNLKTSVGEYYWCFYRMNWLTWRVNFLIGEMTLLWDNFSTNVFANKNWTCFKMFISKVYWWLQSTIRRSSRLGEMQGARDLFTNDWERTVVTHLSRFESLRDIMYEEWCKHFIESFIWFQSQQQFLNWKSHWRHQEDMGQFSAGLFNKVAQSFRKMLRQYVKATVWHFDHLL